MKFNKKWIGILILLAIGIIIILNIKPSQTFSVMPSCGNSICEPQFNESHLTCALDCFFCGDGRCSSNVYPPEHADNCLIDCHEGDNVCQVDYSETCSNSEDCKCTSTQTCSDNICKEIEIIPPIEPTPSIWTQELFKIGNLSITLTMLLIAIGIVFALFLIIGK